MKHIIFIGPPGSGKGTISQLLVENDNYYQLSTGDLLRKEAQSGSELGKEISELIDNGNMVSNEISKKVMIKNLPKDKPIIFDGYPRNFAQVNILINDILPELKTSLEDTVCFYFNIDLKVIEDRIVNRRTCPDCGKIHHLKNIPPLILNKEYVCQDCFTPLNHRKDDTLEALPNRLKTYKEVTLPIIKKFDYVEIDANLSVSKMYKKIKKHL